MKSYNLMFGVKDNRVTAYTPQLFYSDGGNLVPAEENPAPERPADGWSGRSGPNIPWKNWPRDSKHFNAMFHIMTLKVPEEYRKSSELVAVSLFQGNTDFDPQPFDLKKSFLLEEISKEHKPHLRFEEKTDIINGNFGVIWLTEEEFNAGPHYPGEGHDVRLEKRISIEYLEHHAWMEDEFGLQDYTPIWLVERDDINTGKKPNVDNEDGYVHPTYEESIYNADDDSHLGGTIYPRQELPELTPYYLEVQQLPGMNIGEGSLQLDLKTGNFYWQCW